MMKISQRRKLELELLDYAKQKAKKLINKLPKKEDDIYKFLLKRGYLGKRNSLRHNPITNYIKLNLSKYFIVRPGPKYLVILINHKIEHFKLPIRVVRFLSKFNEGKYKNLIGKCKKRYKTDKKIKWFLKLLGEDFKQDAILYLKKIFEKI